MKLLVPVVVLLVGLLAAFNIKLHSVQKELSELKVKHEATVDGFEAAATLYCHALSQVPVSEAVVDPE